MSSPVWPFCSQVIAVFLVSTGGFIDRPVKRQKYPDGINVDNVWQKKTKAETFFKCSALIIVAL